MDPTLMTPPSALPVSVGNSTMSWFGTDPVWLTIFKTVAIFIILVICVLLAIWGERRVVARMQQRLGPNRVGPFGVVQGLADGIKLAFKEEIFPTAADKMVYIVAPVLSVVPAYIAWSVIPFGPQVSMFGHITPLQLTDFPVAVLYVMAVASIGIYGIVLAGWASGSTYPLLGGLRATAQMISYEIAMGLSFVGVFMYSGTMSTSGIVATQQSRWYVLILLPSFLIFIVAMVGETNRAPFDLPEAESELVGGFHVEYGTMKFALFFLAEYINMITVSAVAVTLFLGGWRAPWPISIWSGANSGWYPMIWFFAKVICLFFMFIWLRGTLPRLRYDQFMRFGWKILIPISVVWIMIVSVIRGVDVEYGLAHADWIAVPAGLIVAIISLGILGAVTRKGKQVAAENSVVPEKYEPFAGGFPVPPLPGQDFRPARQTVVSDQPASAETSSQEVSGG